MRQIENNAVTGDAGGVVSEAALQEAVDKVNGALRRMIKNYRREFVAIAVEAGTPRDGGLNLAGVELDGHHYMLMKVPAAALEPLTDRQREIALSVAAGLSNKEVGRRLEITPATVAAHLRVVYRKLHVDSRPALLLRLFAAQDSSASRS